MSTNGTLSEPQLAATEITTQPADIVTRPIEPGEVVTAETKQTPVTVPATIEVNQKKDIEPSSSREQASDSPPSLAAITEFVRTLTDPRSLHQNSLQFTAVICVSDNTGKGFSLPEQRLIPPSLTPAFFPWPPAKSATCSGTWSNPFRPCC